MKCPHCAVVVHESWTNRANLGGYSDGNWAVFDMRCPQCNCLVLQLRGTKPEGESAHLLVYPRASSRPPLPPDVLEPYASDYHEACLVLADSPKASAALSRRCLQRLLREKAGVKAGNLSDEIDEAMPQLPSHLSKGIDAIRNIGNFGAHPIKNTNTGAIEEVAPGEAEWCLDVLEGLFDFYFIQPAILQRKRDELDKKLQDAGKPPLK